MAWADVLTGTASAAPIGAELEPYPYISGFGLLMRLTRLGALTPPEISSLGFRNRAVVDVLVATQQLRSPARSMLQAAGLQNTQVGAHWGIEVWSPVRLGGLLDATHRPARHCLQCAAHGYHCTLFQLPSVDRCPWHDTSLLDACPNCSRLFWSRFDRVCKLGRCECGFDPFNPAIASVDMWKFPTQAADEWATQYLRWAAAEREHRWIAAEPGTVLERGLVVLSPPPALLQPNPCAARLDVEIFDAAGDDPEAGAFWGWSHLAGDRPLTFVPLPGELHEVLTEATREAVERFPVSTQTPLELVTLHGFDEDYSLRDNVANRPECFIAPHGLSADGGTWLNLSAVDPAALLACRAALDRVLEGMGREIPVIDRSAPVLRSEVVDSVSGRRHLSRALAAILCRGYRQGLQAVLQSMMGCTAAVAKDVWFTPVIEFRRREDELVSVRICWVTVAAPPPKRTVDIPQDPATRKPHGAGKRSRRRGRRKPAASGRKRSAKSGAVSQRIR